MEPLKYCYNTQFLNTLSALIVRQDAHFDSKQFSDSVFNNDWDGYELKQRMRHITQCLNKHLSGDYQHKVNILKPVSTHFSSYDAMIFSDFAEQFGLNDYDISIDAMHHFTQYCTAEFAVRPFIELYPEKMMAQMMSWAHSDNHHVRRLASEGCRPRLPWASALPAFKEDPSSILPILEILKNDSSDYVRNSVANNLNDISKDNAHIIINIAKAWKGQTKETDWIVKHACRSLLKQANSEIMSLYGYAEPKHIKLSDFMCTKSLNIGDELHFSFKLYSQEAIGLCRLEFALYFMKANGKQAKKIFKISESNIASYHKEYSKTFSFIPRSTRKLYAGKHSLAIIINGYEQSLLHFILSKKKPA